MEFYMKNYGLIVLAVFTLPVQAAVTKAAVNKASGLVSTSSVAASLNSVSGADSSSNWYVCSHPHPQSLQASQQACDVIVATDDYDSMVKLCSTGAVFAGQKGEIDYCGIIAKSSDAAVALAIGNNSNGQGVQLGYSCAHPAHNPGSKQACDLVVQGAIAGNYDAAFSAVQLCSAGGYDNMCVAISQAGSNANVVRAIGDNSNSKGVQLGYSCAHPAHNPGSKQACALVIQGAAAGNYDAAFSAVQLCAAGGYDSMCAAISQAGNNANVIKAIDANANGKGVQLGYVCMHPTTSPGSSQACDLLALGIAGGSYNAAYSGVQACAANNNPTADSKLCLALDQAGANPQVVKAIGDNANSKGTQLGYKCMHPTTSPGSSQACDLLVQGVVGGSYDAAYSAVQACAANNNSDVDNKLCSALAQAGTNAHVVQAIDDNSNGKGTQLGYKCMHPTTSPGSSQACALLAQGVAGGSYNAAYSSVQACAANNNPTVDDELCSAISQAGTSAHVVQAIGDNANGGTLLGYKCMHANSPGANQACVLLGQGVAGGDYNSAYMAVQVCSAGSNDALCSTIAKQGTNAHVLQAIGDNANGASVNLGYDCGHGGSESCSLIAQGVLGGNADAANVAVPLCSAGGNDDICQALSQVASSASVTSAINANATNGVNLQYACSHVGQAGSVQSCSLLKLAGITSAVAAAPVATPVAAPVVTQVVNSAPVVAQAPVAVVSAGAPSAASMAGMPSGSQYTYNQLLNWCSGDMQYCQIITQAASAGDVIAKQIVNYNCNNVDGQWIYGLCG
jgi:phosphoheptose isomerase